MKFMGERKESKEFAHDQLYRANILDHYKNPRNWKKIEKPTIFHIESNPLCGDEIKIGLKLGKDGKIIDVGILGTGCAISIAAASMLSERILGMDIEKAGKIDKSVVLSDLGIDPGPTRLRCALLALEGLRKAARKKIMIRKERKKE